jgi:hypothetical protein
MDFFSEQIYEKKCDKDYLEKAESAKQTFLRKYTSDPSTLIYP